jgi:microcystin-dependent protein
MPPQGWALCNGQYPQPSPRIQALYAVFGAVYGGDGRTTFALPDLAEAGRRFTVARAPDLPPMRWEQPPGVKKWP